MSTPNHSHSFLWRHYPWLLGLALAPALLGAVDPVGQALVGGLFAVSLFLVSARIGGWTRPSCPRFLQWAVLALLVLPLVPLPAPLVEGLSSHRAALARNFPIVQGTHPTWLPLTVSPANTVQRLWELGLLAACFALARHAAAEKQFPRTLALLLGTVVLLEAAADVWYRVDFARSPLGFWKPGWHDGAGTFVNRNDFADWIYVAALCATGWLLRGLRPLHDARSEPMATPPHSRGTTIFLAGALAFGLIRAVAGGSRGGMLAGLAGVAVWMLLLARRSRSRTRWLVLGLLLVIGLAALLPFSDRLFHRLAATRQEVLAQHSKLEIWRQSFRVFLGFPLFGTGWGTFVTAFNLFKTTGGLNTFWHAENDYVQMLIETGLVGVLVLGTALGFMVRALTRFVGRDRMAEPELSFGAFAALIAFASHAMFEFVLEIPANALLAAALFGFCVGSRDQVNRPVVPPVASKPRLFLNLLGAAGLSAVAAIQGLAAWHWHRALLTRSADRRAEEVRRSVRLWPWEPQRQIGLVRADVQRAGTTFAVQPMLPSLHAQLNQALAWDPFNWELRLERAWLDLTYSTNTAQARAEAWEAVRLNPLQPEIPIRFARHFAARDPALADAFLQSADLSSEKYLQPALELSWHIRHDPGRLWELTPDTVGGLLTLGDFALRQKLFPLATQACQLLTNRVDGLALAERFLQAQRPDLALSVLPNPPVTSRAKLILAKAHFAAGNYAQAITAAESVWQAGGFSPNTVFQPSAGASALPTPPGTVVAQPADARDAVGLAKNDFQKPPQQRDLARLQQSHARFPAERRITWVLYQTELALGHYDLAAKLALQLASQAAAQE